MEYDGKNAERFISSKKLWLGDNTGWRNKNRVNSGIVLCIRLLKLFSGEAEEEFDLEYNTLKTQYLYYFPATLCYATSFKTVYSCKSGVEKQQVPGEQGS